MKIGRIVLLVATGAAIAAGGAYYLGLFEPPPAAIAPVENAATGPAKSDRAGLQGADGSPAADESTAGAQVTAPAFDVVRVEPSGDMVIAGSAMPGSNVEIVTGASVIATAKAGPSGEFAAVLDTPLKPGDYQIVLRATSQDGVVATSTETAVVSVPEEHDGQVLALVEQPGGPSRLITKPEAAGGTGETASGLATKQAPETGAAGAPAGTSALEGAESSGSSQSEAPVASANGTIEAKPAMEPAKTGSEADKSEQMAAVETPGAPGAPKIAGEFMVAVEAVEIDGRRIFIAGTGKPGLPVLVYANDTLLGQVTVSPVGRFLLEVERDLPVGDYIIRADLLDEKGDKVMARAAVPFEREPGESIAAVAPPAAQEGGAAGADAAGPATGEGADGTVLPKLDTEIANTPPTVVGEKLSSVNSSVIIRRGDNLWRISRRVYGRGLRYTTIYLANQDQIRDPDMIWPGQVFSVPMETPEGEVADTTLLEQRWAEEKDKPANPGQ